MFGSRSSSTMRILRVLVLLPIMTLAQHLRHHRPEQLQELSSSFQSLESYPQERHRRTATVERVDNGDCLFGSFIQTPYNGFATSAGTIFTVIPALDMDIVTLEFDLVDNAQDLRAVVFYREGDFSGLINDRTKWTFLASSVAQATQGERGAIIPAGDFKDVPLVAGTLYSFYIHFPGGGLRFKSSDLLIGEDFFTDDRSLMTFQVGVSLNEGPFPNRFIEPSEFNGRLHYKTIQDCESLRESTTVDLAFVIDAEVAPDVLNDLSESVRRAVEALTALVPEMIEFTRNDELEAVGEVSNFLGRSEELCPPTYKLCTLATTTVEYLHLPTITSGEIRRAVLTNEDILGESVKSQSLFDLEYIGEPVNELDFIFTFSGVAPGIALNDIQQRYFEVETIAYLQSRSDILLHVALVNEQVVSEAENDVETLEIRRNRRLSSRQGRKVQALDGLQVFTTIYASAPSRDIRAAVLDGIDSDKQAYLQYLFEQQLRPGDINTDNSGALFATLDDVIVGLNRPAPAPVVVEPPNDSTLWIAFFITLMVVSFFWLLWRIFKDFLYSPKLKQEKLDDSKPARNGGRRPLRRGRSFDDANPRMSIGGNPRPSSRSDHGDPLERRGRSSSPSKKKGAPKRARSMDGLLPRLGKKKDDDNKNLPGTEDMHRVRNPENPAGQKHGVKPSRSLDGLSSMARKRPSDEKDLTTKSAHKDLNVGDNQPKKRTSISKNPAGQKRGVMPARSFDSFRKNQAPNGTPINRKHPPRNQAGQQRGVGPSRSLDGLGSMPQRPPPRSAHSSGNGEPATNQASDNQPGQQRGIRPSRSLEGLSSMQPKKRKGRHASLERPLLEDKGSSDVSKPLPPPQTDATIAQADEQGSNTSPPPPPSTEPSSITQTPKKHRPKNLAGQQRGIKAAHSADGLNSSSNKKPMGNTGGLESSHPPNIAASPKIPPKKHPPKNLAGQKRGIQQARSLDGPDSMSQQQGVQPSRSLEDLRPARPADGVVRSGIKPTEAPPEPPTRLLSPNQPPKKHAPRNQAGQTRSIEASRSLDGLTKPMPQMQQISNGADLASSNSRVGGKESAPAGNQAGQQRGVKASRSLDGLNSTAVGKKHAPRNLKDEILRQRERSRSPNQAIRTSLGGGGKKSAPVGNQAGQQRGVKASGSLDGLTSMAVGKKHAPRNLKDELIRSNHDLETSRQRARSQERSPKQPPKKHVPQNQAGQMRSIKASRSLDGNTKSIPPTRQGSNSVSLVGNQAGQRQGVKASRSLDGLTSMARDHASANLVSNESDESSVESELGEEIEAERQPRQLKAETKNIQSTDQSNPDHSEYSEESDFEEFYDETKGSSSGKKRMQVGKTGSKSIPNPTDLMETPDSDSESSYSSESVESDFKGTEGRKELSQNKSVHPRSRKALTVNGDSAMMRPSMTSTQNGNHSSIGISKPVRQVSLRDVVLPSSDDESFSSADPAQDVAPAKEFWDGKADIEAIVKGQQNNGKDRKKKKKRGKKKKRSEKGDQSIDSESSREDSSEDIDFSSFDVPMDWQPETEHAVMSLNKRADKDRSEASDNANMDWQPVVNVDMETIVRQREEREREERNQQIRATLKADLEEPTDLLTSLSRHAYMRGNGIPAEDGTNRASISMKQEEIRAQLKGDMAEAVDITSMIQPSHMR